MVSQSTMAASGSSEPSGSTGGSSKRHQFADSARPSSNGSHGARPITGRLSMISSQNGIGGRWNSNSTPSGSGSRKLRLPSGPSTSGISRSVNEKPCRGAPNAAMAVSPAASPGFRTVAVSWDIDRPRRSTCASTCTGPTATLPAKTAVTVRGVCVGSPSSSAIARTASAATIPPWGTTASIHGSEIVDSKHPGRDGTDATSRSAHGVAPTATTVVMHGADRSGVSLRARATLG